MIAWLLCAQPCGRMVMGSCLCVVAMVVVVVVCVMVAMVVVVVCV